MVPFDLGTGCVDIAPRVPLVVAALNTPTTRQASLVGLH
jgi:hypothetical protein